jgi:hypothetical protein
MRVFSTEIFENPGNSQAEKEDGKGIALMNAFSQVSDEGTARDAA